MGAFGPLNPQVPLLTAPRRFVGGPPAPLVVGKRGAAPKQGRDVGIRGNL